MIKEDNISYFAVEFNKFNMWIIKNKKKIMFMVIKDKELIYDKDIEEEISNLNYKISVKLDEYISLISFKENGTLNNILTTIGKINTFFVPSSTIVSLVALFKTNINKFMKYNIVLVIIVVALIILQAFIIKFTLIPLYKLSKFNWKIK